MKQVCGDYCLSRSNDFMWHKRFLDGSDTVENDQRSGRSISSRAPEIIEKVQNFVANDRCASLRMIADSLNINKKAIRIIRYEDLGKTKVCAKFVPHTLSPEQKAMRSAHCRDIISAAENDPNFLRFIVTGDERNLVFPI
ncbi:protein GVQW3 [Trichonephila clavipes]|nr:protein GVQW3 [Trichonephila clavipes]